MTERPDSGALTLATQGGIAFVGNVFGKGLAFAFVAIATRLVTPEEYGVFTLALSIALFVEGIASLNIYRALDHYLPQFFEDDSFGLASSAFFRVTALGLTGASIAAPVVALFGGYLATVFDAPGLVTILPLFALLIPVQTLNRTLLATFNSLKKMQYRVAVKDLLNPTGRILAAVLLVSIGFGVVGLAGGYLLGVTMAVLVGFSLLFYKADWLTRDEGDRMDVWPLMRYSVPLVFAGVIYALVGQIDYFVIGYFLGTAPVGRYRVAYLLAANLLIVLHAFTPIFKPMVAENISNSAVLGRRYRLATRWITILTLPTAITLILAPEAFLSVLFTPEYAVASGATVALAIGYLINAGVGPEGMVLEGLGRTRLTLLNTIVLLSVNVALDVLLVPRLGILGAGIGTATARTVASLLGAVENYLLRSVVPFTGRSLRIWSAAIPAVIGGQVITSAVQSNVITTVILPIGVLVTYLVGLKTLRGFTDEDRDLAEQLDDRLGINVFARLTARNWR
jgi:O-antigen/teichoic acid export membrane protein